MNLQQALGESGCCALKDKSAGFGMVTGRKIMNSCLIKEKKKKIYPSVVSGLKMKGKVELNKEALTRDKRKEGGGRVERSLSQNKICYEKVKKTGFSQNLSPVLKSSERKWEFFKEIGKSCDRNVGLGVKEKKCRKLSEWGSPTQRKIIKKIVEDSQKSFTERGVSKKPLIKLAIPASKKPKIKSKSQEKSKIKKKPELLKTKQLKKKGHKKLAIKPEEKNNDKLKITHKKIVKSLFSKLKKHKKHSKPKKTEQVISSLDTTRKKVKNLSEPFGSDLLSHPDFFKSMKTIKYIDADSLNSSQNVSTTQINPALQPSPKLAIASLSSESQNTVIHNSPLENSPKVPKKVEKVLMSTFHSIIKSKNPSFSVESEIFSELTEKLKDSIESQYSDSDFSEEVSNKSVQLVSNLDINEGKPDFSEDFQEINQDLYLNNPQDEEPGSSEYSDPEESLKTILQQSSNTGIFNFIERPCVILIKTPEISVSDSNSEVSLQSSAYSKPDSPKPLDFDSELTNILKSEIEFFLESVSFSSRLKEIDPSSDFIQFVFSVIQKVSKKHEKKILSELNSAFGEVPLEKLERIQLAENGAIVAGFSYELLLDDEVEKGIQTELKIEDGQGIKNFYFRLVFEAVNEALNWVRPFGFRGMPDPWDDRSYIWTGAKSIEEALSKAESCVEKWESVKVGMIPVEFGFDEEEKVEKLREDRLNIILSQNIEEEEPDWVFYNWEETQSKIEVSKQVFDHLLRETALILSLISYN